MFDIFNRFTTMLTKLPTLRAKSNYFDVYLFLFLTYSDSSLVTFIPKREQPGVQDRCKSTLVNCDTNYHLPNQSRPKTENQSINSTFTDTAPALSPLESIIALHAIPSSDPHHHLHMNRHFPPYQQPFTFRDKDLVSSRSKVFVSVESGNGAEIWTPVRNRNKKVEQNHGSP